jgi:hypothetical protein
MPSRLMILALVAALALATPAPGQQGTIVFAERTAQPEILRDLGACNNAIVGAAVNAARAPVANARVRLRSLMTGQVVRTTDADAGGRFAFCNDAPGTYIVELLAEDGAVAALSEAVTIATGEITEIQLQLGDRTRSFAWWFGSAATSLLASAASLGVLTVEPGAPVSPPR